MDEIRKNAYRYLLCEAMLQIRVTAWNRAPFWKFWNPRAWRDEANRNRFIADLADWLHNLAEFAAMDFEGFNEERFWKEEETCMKRNSQNIPSHYRWHFDQRLQRDQSKTELE